MRSSLYEKIDRLSRELVHVNICDRKSVAEFSGWFWRMSEWALEISQLETAVLTSAAASVLEKLRRKDERERDKEFGFWGEKEFLEYQTSRARVANQGTIKQMLVKELREMEYINNTGDKSWRRRRVNKSVKN